MNGYRASVVPRTRRSDAKKVSEIQRDPRVSISDDPERAWREYARCLGRSSSVRAGAAVVLLLAGCDAGAPPPPAQKPVVRDDAAPRDAAPPVDAVVMRHRHAIRRDDLTTPDVDKTKLPVHGVALASWYLGGASQSVIDFDAATLRHHEASMLADAKPIDRTRKLTPAQVERFRSLAFAAWHEDPTGPTPQATDIRQDLIVLDGDEAFSLSGYPITLSLGEQNGRPAAAAAVSAILYQVNVVR